MDERPRPRVREKRGGDRGSRNEVIGFVDGFGVCEGRMRRGRGTLKERGYLASGWGRLWIGAAV